MKMRIFQRGLILVGLPLVLELVLIGSLGNLAYQSAQQRATEARYRKYSSQIARLLGYVSSAPLVIAAAAHYSSNSFLEEYKRQKNEIHLLTVAIRKTMDDIPEITLKEYSALFGGLQSILTMTDQLADICHGYVSMDDAQGFQNSLAEAKKVVAVQLNEMFTLSDRMVAAAQEKLDRTRQYQFDILFAGLALNIIMGVFLSRFYLNGIVNRIRTIAGNTQALARGQPLAAEIGGQDEIAQFDRAFHSMLEQLIRASQHEQELFDNASDVICVLDADHRFLRVNPASRKDWGMAPEEICGRKLDDLLLAGDMPAVNSSLAEAFSGGAAVSFEARIETGDRKTKIGLWSAYWSHDEEKLFCIVHDVSDRKLIELAKKQFLTLISSDLKIPLARISEAMKKLPELNAATLNDLGREKLKMAERNLERLLGLVSELLGVASMDSGEMEIHPQPGDLFELIARACADVEPLLQSRQLKIEYAPCRAVLPLDPDRIMQVLVNLFSNAIKFSPVGAVVSVFVERQGDLFVCRVSDKGRGVPESHRTSIFERFSQVEKQDGRRKAGTGLGLPICKQIVEKHGGKIGVESQEGKGSTFWFSLPAELAPAPSPKSAGSQSEVETSSAALAAAAAGSTAALARHPFGTSLPLKSKGLVLVGIPVILELVFVGFLSNSLVAMQSDRTQELRYRQMAVNASKVSKSVLYASSVVADQADKVAWQAVKACYREWSLAQDGLEALVADDDYARKQYDRLIVHSRKIKAYRDSLLRQRNDSSSDSVASGLAQKLRYLPSALALTKYLRAIIEHAENKEFISPEKEMETLQSQFYLLGAGVVAGIGISVAMALFFSLNISRRILIMADNAERLAGDEPLNPLMGGRDELAELDRSFHQTAAALSESRKKERAVFDNSKDVLCVIDAGGRFLSVNAAVEASWGYSRKELVELSLDDLIIPEDLPDCRSALLGEIDPGQGITHECRIRKKSGEACHVLFAASRQSGQTNTFCVVHDISDRIALEELRANFLTMVSHDLRTPLTAVKGVAQIMQAGVFGAVTAPAEASLAEIKRNADSLLELINDILDLEKLDAGKMQLTMEKMQVSEILEQVKKQVDLLPGPLVIETPSGECRGVLEADRERLSQSISNLAKFLILRSNEAVTFAISQSDSRVEIKLTDNGPLLSDLDRKQLFLRVKEAAATGKLGPDCTFHADLLLPLAARVIEAHGGSLNVESTGGNRNLICVLIPVCRS
jgi:PAS domain S-box-containing protein